MLVTSCPLCKKTFDNVTEKTVVDIAQLVSQNIIDFSDVQKETSYKQKEEVLS